MITKSAFDYVRELVRDTSGVVLDETKDYLVEARLEPIVKAEGCLTLEEFVAKLRVTRWSETHRRTVEAVVTTETSFFRDLHPFEALKKTVLPRLIQSRAQDRTLRICSAACSSGQEPYSIAMVLHEHFAEVTATWNVEIFAADLSLEMIKRAREGRYSVLEANRGLPARLLAQYFRREGMYWQVTPKLRQQIEFRCMNLLREELPCRFDLVLIRNVLMYFDVETKRKVLDKVARSLEPDGLLLIGGTETIMSHRKWKRHVIDRTSCYSLRSTDGDCSWTS